MNKELLEYEIKRQGMTIAGFCQKIGMSRSTFYKKCVGKSDFCLFEIKKILDVLSIKDPTPIFFASEVS